MSASELSALLGDLVKSRARESRRYVPRVKIVFPWPLKSHQSTSPYIIKYRIENSGSLK